VRDADRVAELLMRDTATDVMKTFLFTDIVGSTELASAAASDRLWVSLLRRHDDVLRAIFADYHGQVVDHTGDGFFAAFEEAGDALGAAVAIQQAVDRDFEFDIRIGVHTDGALKMRENYHGKGVHAAARIGAAAAGREILTSHATVDGLEQFAVEAPRSLTLKGFREPIDVCSVTWAAG
jgi:class 3 adenylate cyclase